MANEIQSSGYISGIAATYATVRRAADGQIYTGSGWEAINVANWDTYDVINLTEQSTSGFYYGTMLALPAGVYYIDMYVRASGVGGAAVKANDQRFSSAVLDWKGAAEANLNELPGILTTAHGAGSWQTATGFAVPGSAMTLTAGERDATAAVVESHLLNEGDSQMLINAIVGAIGNVNIDQAILVAAIRSDLERVGGNLNTVVTRLTAQRAANLDNLDMLISDIPTAAENTTAIAAALVTAHGAGSWTTATGFAVPGSQMTLVDNAITEAKISTPAEAPGIPTGILGMVRRLFERGRNKRTRDRASGITTLRNVTDTGNLESNTQSSIGVVDTISLTT